ncbi:MAG: hypothetical protein ACXAEF_04555 [Candidatus Thorarchaeota archaeon]
MSLLLKTEYTVCDVINALVPNVNESESLDFLLEIIEDELYICEDRRGGTDAVVSDLFELSSFIRKRLIPLRNIGHFEEMDDSPSRMLERFIESNITKTTCSHMLLQANTQSIHRSIQVLSEAN